MRRIIVFILPILAVGILGFSLITGSNLINDSKIVCYTIDLNKEDVKFYWKDAEGNNYKSLGNLKESLEEQNKKVLFLMNGGMYNKDLSPQGLFIQSGKMINHLDTIRKGYGNFYLHPNGVFYITYDNVGGVCTTQQFQAKNVKYATQSGPMLLINGTIHPKFNKGSENVHIRNGVGILPNGELLFALSKETINFYDFASFFKQKGCKNALYLDGYVSRAYVPSEQWNQLDGNFGVIVGASIKR